MKFRCDRCGKLVHEADACYSPITGMPVCEECYQEEEGGEEDGDAC